MIQFSININIIIQKTPKSMFSEQLNFYLFAHTIKDTKGYDVLHEEV